jgi:outer membrane protein OmpA-like peptidoglycan-associated protein
MDIYKSEMGPDNFFSIPVNLGKAVNSEKDDFGFIIKNNINKGLITYFSSNRDGGKGNDDIYGFIADAKPGLKTLVIRGEITEENSPVGISKVSVKLFDGQDNVIKEVYSKNDGTYRVEIPFRKTVKIEVSKPLYSSFIKEYEAEALEQFQNKTMLDIKLTQLDELVQEREEQTVIKMNKFFFAPGEFTVTPEIAAELDNAVDAVKKFPQLQLRIEAHTDSRGGKTANLRLSQGRADAIRKYLLDNGVAISNILDTVGYGEEKITNNCADGVYCLEILHKQNERHFIVVTNYELLTN